MPEPYVGKNFLEVFSAPVIEIFKNLQESCKQPWKQKHTTCKLLAKLLQDLNHLARILQD